MFTLVVHVLWLHFLLQCKNVQGKKEQTIQNIQDLVIFQYNNWIFKILRRRKSAYFTNLQSAEGLIQSDRSNGADDDRFRIPT